MFYKGTVEWYNDLLDETKTYGILVSADNYVEAIEKLVHQYGESTIVGFSLETFSPDNVLEFGDMSQFSFMTDTLAANILW